MKPKRHRFKIEIKPGVTNDFKMGIVVLVFFITCFHLFEVIRFPDFNLVPNEILLSAVLFAVVYLWVQEIRDRNKLEVINSELLITQEELKGSNLAAITALIVSEEARDPYLSGHSRRVTQYAMAIADRMNINQSEKRHIEYAGYLHDIGKIGIKDEGASMGEQAAIRRHTVVVAQDILEPLKFLPREKIIIRHHHERYDGKGYPDGLKGKDIPLGSRIIAIADLFDIMNSERPDRPPFQKERIISELKASRGTHFDPEVVDIFLDMIKSDDIFFNK